MIRCRYCTQRMVERYQIGWCPTCEVGASLFPYDPEVYDENYARELLARSETDFARTLNIARHDLVRQHAGDALTLDFGCGVGAYLRADAEAWGYEPRVPLSMIPEDVRARVYPSFRTAIAWDSVACFWDTLEHVERPDVILNATHARIVFISMPIVPPDLDGVQLPGWRHFKPREHLWYATVRGMVQLLAFAGYRVAAMSDFETKLGRQDIRTFVAIRGE